MKDTIHQIYLSGKYDDFKTQDVDDVLKYLLNVVVLDKRYNEDAPLLGFSLFMETDETPTEGFEHFYTLDSVMNLIYRKKLLIDVNVWNHHQMFVHVKWGVDKSQHWVIDDEEVNNPINLIRRFVSLCILEMYGVNISYDILT